MPSQVRAVVAHSKDAPVQVETIIVPDPGPGEALVTVQACGCATTDLHYREGGIGDDFPYLLGHEAAGDGGGGRRRGDQRRRRGRLRHPELAGGVGRLPVLPARATPWYCFNTHNAQQKMTLADGTRVVAGPGHRSVRGEDSRRRRPMHHCGPDGPGHGGRTARLRGGGRTRRRALTTGNVGRGDLGRGVRLRRCR